MSNDLTIRIARPEDAAICGPICFEAFDTINRHHGFPGDVPSPEIATHMLAWMFGHPHFYCVVAEADGRIAGSNCLDERSIIFGVGPITIDPQVQNRGVGRALMRAVMDRAAEQRAPGVRLVQAAFHNRSLSLYQRLGFDIREPLSCLQGRTVTHSIPGCTVRAAHASDVDACNALSMRVHGFARGGELSDGIAQGSARVVMRADGTGEEKITGYSSSLAFFGHSTAETNLDLQAMMASVDSFGGPGILMPSRNNALLRWSLENGLRIVQQMTLMSTGLYGDPAGAWLPSVSF